MTGLLITLLLGVGISFAESGLGLGMVFPGETAVVVLAATMQSGPEIVLLGIFVALGASAGDHVGFAIGRRYGDALRGTGVVRRLGVDHYDHATAKLRRHGGLAVFLTRLVPVVRTLTPAAAGASGLSYRRFAPASLAGSAMWAGVYVVGGSVAGAVAAMTSSALGDAAWLVPALAVLACSGSDAAALGRRDPVGQGGDGERGLAGADLSRSSSPGRTGGARRRRAGVSAPTTARR